MKIQLKHVTIDALTEGYADNKVDGVIGYGGNLDIRPKYQREFVYKEKQRNAVIDSVLKGYPLNVMYWVENSANKYEVLDGQQRIISICEYVDGNFSVNGMYFHSLPSDKQASIRDYQLMVYTCSGTESEKLEWFRTINIAGEKLTEQELRNATYTGTWLTSAKEYFSKPNCPAHQKGGHLLDGSPIRQEYLETVLKWISKDAIVDYMSIHQKDKDADELWQYFQDVINWVHKIFPKYSQYKKYMKGIHWGLLYNEHKDEKYNTQELQARIETLMSDEEVENKSGIFNYLITKKEKHLNLRSFPDSIKRAAFESQKVPGNNSGQAKCVKCGNMFVFDDMEGDHITPWHKGGKTIRENCQMLCMECNRTKSGF